MPHRLNALIELSEFDRIVLAGCRELGIGLYDPGREKVATALIELVHKGESNSGALHRRAVLELMNR